MNARCTLAILFFITCCCLKNPGVARADNATDAGTSIVNQADLTYLDTLTGENIRLLSNTARVVVVPLKRFELSRSQTQLTTAGARVLLVHQLKNTGNLPDSYRVGVDNLLADDADLINLMLYIDSNNNGVIDPAEPVAADAIALNPGEHVNLLVGGIVPPDIMSMATIQVSVLAESMDDDVAAQVNRDELSVANDARLTMNLTNSPECSVNISTDERINYELVVSNSSDILPGVRTIFIDGEQRSGIVLEIDIPEALDLVHDALLDIEGFQATAIVQRSEDGDNWMDYASWQGNTRVDRLGVLVPPENFAINETVSVRFGGVARIHGDIDAFTLQALVDYDNDQIPDVESNTVCNTVLEPAAAIGAYLRFVEPTISLRRAGTVPDFAKDSDFTDTNIYRVQSGLGDYRLSRDGVYLELQAFVSEQLLLEDAAGIAHVLVTLQSATAIDGAALRTGLNETGDIVNVLLRETSPGSQRYRSVRPVLLSRDLASAGSYCPGTGDGLVVSAPDYSGKVDVCVLRSRANDKLHVSFTDFSTRTSLEGRSFVDPLSRVFDSASLAGIADATVTVFDGDQVAKDPISDESLIIRTDENGLYKLPRLSADGSYTLSVEPPDSHLFPSLVAPATFESLTVLEASYGATGFQGAGDGRFSVSYAEALPVVDIPLDPVNRNNLLQLDKSVETHTIEPGEFTTYRLVINNSSDARLEKLTVIDTPPVGFRYVPGSSLLKGERIDDPAAFRLDSTTAGLTTENEPTFVVDALRYELDSIDADESLELTYSLQATAAAIDGNGINTAQVSALSASGLLLSTQPSKAQVNVARTGVLSDRGIVFGKVYVDSSCDGLQNLGEWPIAGVRLYMHDGSYVTTDEDGQYSLYGLKPGLHTIKIDSLSMPAGLELMPLDTAHAADPHSRFIELSAGDFHRADFATNCPQHNPDGMFEHLRQRSRQLRGSWLLEEAARLDADGSTQSTNKSAPTDSDGDLSHGTLGPQRPRTSAQNTASNEPLGADVLPHDAIQKSESGKFGTRSQHTEQQRSETTAGQPRKTALKTARTQVTMGNPKELVKDITAEQAKTGHWLWPAEDISTDGRFMAVVKAGLDPVLYINDVQVPYGQIGEQLINQRERAQIVAWYGVELSPGLNKVEVRGKDSFGNDRVLASHAFKRPAAAVRMMLRTPQDTLPADGGRSTLPIDIVLSDANGYPASGVYFVTVQTTAGDFLEEDLQLQEPGIQLRIEYGRGKVHLRSSDQTGSFRVRASTGALDASLNLVQVAAARPLIATGLIELGGQWNDSSGRADKRTDPEDVFELDARAAVFLKGRVRDDLHLTLAYDSDKSSGNDLLRDFNPADTYPTLGDASQRGYEAQSRSKLFAKLERDRSSVMWGDYLTDNATDSDDLTRIQRTLTGFNGVYDNGDTRAQLFLAEQSDSREFEEIRGNGTAMLFQLAGAPIVANSEVIELVVRDRDNTGLIVSSTQLIRYSDYTLDSVSGFLSFTRVIPSVDEDLNPVFLRIAYDRGSDLSTHLVAGLRLQKKLGTTSSLSFGLTDDQNPLSGYTLSGIRGKFQLGLNTTLVATAALQTHRTAQEEGGAQRVRIEHTWGGQRDHQTMMTWARADSSFQNPGASITAGRSEWRIEHRQALSNTVKLTAEVTNSESIKEASRHTNAGITASKSFSHWSVRGGARHIQGEEPFGRFRYNTALLGAEKRFLWFGGRRASFGVDYERDVAMGSRYRVGTNMRVQVHDQLALYGRHETQRGLTTQSVPGSPGNSSQLVIGAESDILPATQLYSEYRMRGSFTGRSIEAASGVRGRYDLRPGLSVSPALEVIDALQGVDSTDSVALSMGVSDTRNANRKLTAQIEIRDAGNDHYLGGRFTAAQRLNLDWTGMVRDEFTRQSPDSGGTTIRHAVTVGLSRRPKLDNRHHMLMLANWKTETTPADGVDRTTYLLSTHQNKQIKPGHVLSGRVGLKWQNNRISGKQLNTQLMLTDVRSTFNFRRRWEFDVRAGVLTTGAPSDVRYSIGAGAAWLVDRNLRLGVGYNVLGFRDDDLDQQASNARGLRVGLQFKFDEYWYKWLENGNAQSHE